MSTSAIHTVMTDIRNGIAALSMFSDIGVYSGPVTAEEGGQECVWMDEATFNEEEAAMGGERGEVWDIKCQVWAAVKSYETSTEDAIQAARERVVELLAAIETYINDTYTTEYPNVVMQSGTLKQGILSGGRGCSVDFTLTMSNIKNP